MFTKLSSLLVQDGVVSVKKVEEALQRQVIFGGGLDTILLEIGAVDEISLCRFLHVAAGVPAADLSSLADTDLRDAGMLTAETARSYGMVPIRKDDDILHVLVKPGVGRTEYEELSYILGLRVVPYVAPEVRVEELIQRAYGGELEHRFEVLLEKLGPAPDLRAAGVPAVVLGADEEVEIEAMLPDSGDVPSDVMAMMNQEAPDTAVSDGREQPPAAVDIQERKGEETEGAETEAAETQGAAKEFGHEPAGVTGIEPEGAEGAGPSEPAAAPQVLQPGVDDQGNGSVGVSGGENRGLTGATIPGLPVTAPVAPAEAVHEHLFQRSDTLVDMPAFEPDSDWNEDEVETAPEAKPWVGPTAQELAGRGVRAQTVRGIFLPSVPPAERQVAAPEGPPQEGGAASQPRESLDRDAGVVVSGELAASGPSGEIGAETARGAIDGQPKVLASLGDLVEQAREAKGEIHVPAGRQPAGEDSGPTVQVNLDIEPSGPGPLSIVALDPGDALSAMEDAANRDEILELMVRAAVSRVEYAALFVVYGDHAVGRVAAGPAGLDRSAIRRVSLPLGAPSLFKTVVDTGSQFYGPVVDEGLNFSVLTSMDRISAPNVLVMPVRLGRRVVCVLYCDHGTRPVEPSVVADLAGVPQAAARAFSRLILATKRARYEDGSQSADAVKAPADQVPAKTKETAAEGWSGPGESAGATSARRSDATPSQEKVTAVSVEAGQSPERLSHAAIELMLDQVEQGGALAQRARAVLIEGGLSVVESVLRRFPGRLNVDRHLPGEKLPPVEELGPLLELVVAMGNQVAGAFLPLLGAPDPEVRFHATYLFSELTTDDAVPLLYQRLFDEDPGIRSVARHAIQRCAQTSDLRRSVLEHLRGALQQGVPFHRICAAEGVAAFKDKVAVPMLIDMLGHQSQDVTDAAQEALVAVTKHNFGQDRETWWSWWQENHGRHRVEWMLDSLVSQDLECRFLAMQELAELAGDTFGYRFDLGRDEIGAAVARWRTWWEQVRSILAE